MNVQTIVAVFGVIAVYTVTVVGFGMWFSNTINNIKSGVLTVLEDKHKENREAIREISVDHANLDRRVSRIEWHQAQRAPTYQFDKQ